MGDQATWEIFLAIDDDEDFGFDVTAYGAVDNYMDEFAGCDTEPTKLIKLTLTKLEDDQFKAEAEILPVPELATSDDE